MAFLYGREWSKVELLERAGDISQYGGARLMESAEGPEAHVPSALFRTGSGLNFHVLPGRGMDISLADYCGWPLCWRSSTGDVGAGFYEPEGRGWLRGFFGGLLTTCGGSFGA